MPTLIRSGLSVREQIDLISFDDYATNSTGGIVKVVPANGITLKSSEELRINKATDAQTKAGTDSYMPIVPANQDKSVFYGLAKAAGDTSQASSSNAVGTYTTAAKAAIAGMLGLTGEVNTVEVSGTDLTITALANHRYICGELSTLDFTPCASGICSVLFESGTTVTILTLPNTVKMPEWFDATSLETETIYEMSFVDGVYGAVMTWQS